MPALSKRDPRYYVKQVPLPIAPPSGIKIQARNDKVFNPTVPERDEIRKLNYKRRQEQMTSQGFRCVQHKPYKGIGDPFYLDHKKLILHALGQLEETGEQPESSDSSESEDEEERVKQLQQQLQHKSFTTTNFFVRRTRKDLNTIPKKHAQGKDLIRNVKLGHGLFYMLRRERQQKVEAEQRKLRKKQEALRNEWQPPKRDSDSEGETDDEFEEDVELNEYMQSSHLFDDAATTTGDKTSVGETFLTETKPEPEMVGEHSFSGDTTLPPTTESYKASRVAFQGVDHVDTEEGTTRIKSAKSTIYTRASSAKSSRRKGPSARPYTPQHANITRGNDVEIDKIALFRQLCALCWLLEAMGTENPNIMAPISQCWSMREIGGSKGKDRKQEKERLDTTWRQFVAKQHQLKVASRRGTNRLSKGGRRYGNYPSRPSHRGSISATHVSISDTPTGSVSVLNESMNMSTMGGQSQPAPNIRVNSAIPESSEKESGQDPNTEDEEENTGLFRFLDEYYASLHNQESSGGGEGGHPSTVDDKQSNADGTSVYSARSDKRASEAGAGRKGRAPGTTPAQETQIPEYKDLTPQQISNILESIERSYIDPRLHKLSNPTERRTSKTMRADINVRPKSSPAVLEFKASLPSNKKYNMASDLRQGFVEVYQNKALILHDTLEALEREKLRKIQNKFIHLPTKGSSFHRAVGHMRSRSVTEEENLRESQRRQSLYQQWFMDLDSNIPEDIKHDWYISKVLQRLQRYGVMEASKQSAYNFLMVLSGLRDWEICAPDISAAIEFCREKIVEMSVDDYEEWFHQQFPKVIRPQTAPAACKREERASREQASGKRLMDANNKVPMSAPPGQRRAIKA